MSIARRGSRKVVHEGTQYTWVIRKTPTYAQANKWTPMKLAVQLSASVPHRVLSVNLVVSRPDNWLSKHATGITPNVVRDIIRRALANGWEPQGPGRPYPFEYFVIQDSVGNVMPEPKKKPAITARSSRRTRRAQSAPRPRVQG